MTKQKYFDENKESSINKGYFLELGGGLLKYSSMLLGVSSIFSEPTSEFGIIVGAGMYVTSSFLERTGTTLRINASRIKKSKLEKNISE